MIGSRVGHVLWSIATASLVSAAVALPVLATSVAEDCPPTPTTLSALIAVDTGAEHPLSDAYGRTVWAYTERAAACYGTREFDLAVFVGGPEGIGGTMAFAIEPRWVIDERFVAVDPLTTDPGVEDQFFPIAVRPGLQGRFEARAGTEARITGHFNDRVADTCRVVHGDPPDAPPPDVAVEICLTAFVLTSIRGPDDPPVTDTIEPATASDDGIQGGMVMVGLGFLAATTVLVASWHLARRRP